MRYQAIKHNKTGSRVLGIFQTIDDAREAIRRADPYAAYQGLSYIGGFPYYHDTTKQDARPYTIQGYADVAGGVVCAIKKEEIASVTN